MKIFKNFNLFIESTLGELANLKGKGEVIKKFQDYQSLDFDFSKNLVKYITLKERNPVGEKIRFSIEWNDTALHNIQKRIKERTSFKSTEEFNSYFKEILNRIFPNMIGNEISSSGEYSIYDKEKNFSIIIAFDISKYLNRSYEITVITILPGKKGYKVEKILDI